MTRDDILRIAREAGFKEHNGIVRTMHGSGAWAGINEEIERFAALIAAAEREACALVCDENAHRLGSGPGYAALMVTAESIRARGAHAQNPL